MEVSAVESTRIILVLAVRSVPRLLMAKSQYIRITTAMRPFARAQDTWAHFWDDVFACRHNPAALLSCPQGGLFIRPSLGLSKSLAAGRGGFGGPAAVAGVEGHGVRNVAGLSKRSAYGLFAWKKNLFFFLFSSSRCEVQRPTARVFLRFVSF